MPILEDSRTVKVADSGGLYFKMSSSRTCANVFSTKQEDKPTLDVFLREITVAPTLRSEGCQNNSFANLPPSKLKQLACSNLRKTTFHTLGSVKIVPGHC